MYKKQNKRKLLLDTAALQRKIGKETPMKIGE